MKLKVLHVSGGKLIRNSVSHEEILDGRIQDEKSIDNNLFHVFSMHVDSSPSSYGVKNRDNGTTVPLKKMMEDSSNDLIKLRFCVIDYKNKTIYFDGRIEDVRKILKTLFDVNHEYISYEVGIEEFHSLSSLQIKTVEAGQISSNDEEILSKPEILDGLYNDDSVAESTFEVRFRKKGKNFQKNQLSTIVKQYTSERRKITIKGFDEKGHSISYSSTLSRKIEILKNKSDWESKISLSFEEIVEEIKKVVRDENTA